MVSTIDAKRGIFTEVPRAHRAREGSNVNQSQVNSQQNMLQH